MEKYTLPVATVGVIAIAAVVLTAGHMDDTEPPEEQFDIRDNMTEQEICSRTQARINDMVGGEAHIENTGSVELIQIEMIWNGQSSGRKDIDDIEVSESVEVGIPADDRVSEIKLADQSCDNKILDTYLAHQ